MVQAEGTAVDCAATGLLEILEDDDKRAYTESVFRSTLGSMYAGGADTVCDMIPKNIAQS